MEGGVGGEAGGRGERVVELLTLREGDTTRVGYCELRHFFNEEIKEQSSLLDKEKKMMMGFDNHSPLCANTTVCVYRNCFGSAATGTAVPVAVADASGYGVAPTPYAYVALANGYARARDKLS